MEEGGAAAPEPKINVQNRTAEQEEEEGTGQKGGRVPSNKTVCGDSSMKRTRAHGGGQKRDPGNPVRCRDLFWAHRSCLWWTGGRKAASAEQSQGSQARNGA